MIQSIAIQSTTFTYPSADGIHTVYARKWLPQDPPRGVVQIVHGVSEHVDRYDELARFLAGHGYVVCGEDHLGHGHTVTDGKFGWFGPREGWSLLGQDIARLRRSVGEEYPGLPYLMLGHSMGSFLTRTYLIDHPGDLTGAILSGTGQESAPLVAAGKALSSLLAAAKGSDHVSPLVQELSLGGYNKAFRPNRTSADWLTRDEAAVDAYLADPFCTLPLTVGLFRDMMGGLQYIAKPENLARMDPTTPVYIYSGEQDPVGAMGAGVRKVHTMFREAGCRDLELKLYPDGRHEMHNEFNKDEVFADLLAWLDRHS